MKGTQYSVAISGNNLVMPNTFPMPKDAWEFMKYATSLEVNAFINKNTGYMLNNVNSPPAPGAGAVGREPAVQVAYDQLGMWTTSTCPLLRLLNLEVVALLQQMLQDGSMSAEEAYEQLLIVCEDLLPGGNAETYP